MSAPLKVIFAGTPEFAAVALRALLDSHHDVIAVYTQPDRPAGRGRKLTPSPVKGLAREHDIVVCQPVTLKDAEAQRQLADLNADVMVVVAYGLLLPPAVIEIPRLGCVNIHASLLPRWRGAAPIQRAILAGDSETGVTIMQMDAGLDTGAMLLKRNTPIGREDSAQTLHDRLAEIGAAAAVEVLDQLSEGRLEPEAQDDSQACYAAKLSKAEALIDWHQPALDIERRVRAFNPWPVAQTRLGEDVLRVWQAQALDDVMTQAQPGSVIRAGKTGIDVATGKGVLRIVSAQLPGKRAMAAADLLNARKELKQPGHRLGSAG
ncbi:methionyl-tRNA formyltransferase [Candidatus Tenderia electrophaga]|jgi:methionyl-tRNA formyltransferase|uniref:Methionyl-tRNA formyltransferase n=1 Tax=Candidatus Tenderia electrophaga TaxID=1748243 RepID=A0A0S2TGR6_9GAMM|nr:methionyl-tRNA formyltransferase [Candidatus Tenderia electrophaga]